MINFNNVKIFSGSSNLELAKKIAEKSGLQLGKAEIQRFKDGEVYIEIEETVRGRDVFVVQSTSEPVNENLMELLIFVDALRRASAKTINVIIPYYGYARQDRKSKPREPITSKLVANLLTTAGVNRVITMDLHADQIQGFFDIPVDHMQGLPLMAKYFKEKGDYLWIDDNVFHYGNTNLVLLQFYWELHWFLEQVKSVPMSRVQVKIKLKLRKLRQS